MLTDSDLKNFVQCQLLKSESLTYLSHEKRSSSARIGELWQGTAALFVLIFAIGILHPTKGAEVYDLQQRLLGSAAIFAIAELCFVTFCWFLFRKTERSITAFTNQRILQFKFKKPVTELDANELRQAANEKITEIPYDLIKSARIIAQPDDSGLLVMEVYDGPQKSTWYHIQLEIYNSNEARSSIPNSVQLIFESTKGKDHSRSLSNRDP